MAVAAATPGHLRARVIRLDDQPGVELMRSFFDFTSVRVPLDRLKYLNEIAAISLILLGLLLSSQAYSQVSMEAKYKACLALAVPNETKLRYGANTDQALHDSVCRKTDTSASDSSSTQAGGSYAGYSANYGQSNSGASRNIDDFCQSASSTVNAVTQMTYWSKELPSSARSDLQKCLSGSEKEAVLVDSDDGQNLTLRVYYDANKLPIGASEPHLAKALQTGIICNDFPIRIGDSLTRIPGQAFHCHWANADVRSGEFEITDDAGASYGTPIVRYMPQYGVLSLNLVRQVYTVAGMSQSCSPIVKSQNLDNVGCQPGCDSCTAGTNPSCRQTVTLEIPGNDPKDVHLECTNNNDGSCEWNGVSDTSAIYQDSNDPNVFYRDLGSLSIGVRACGMVKNYQTQTIASNGGTWRLFPGYVLSIPVVNGNNTELQLNLNGNLLSGPIGQPLDRLVPVGSTAGPTTRYYKYLVQ